MTLYSPFLPPEPSKFAAQVLSAIGVPPGRTFGLRLIAPIEPATASRLERQFAGAPLPRLAWADQVAKTRALGFGEGLSAEALASAPPISVFMDATPTARCEAVPNTWFVWPFDKQSRRLGASQDGVWGAMSTGLEWMPQLLWWREGARDWVIFSAEIDPEKDLRAQACSIQKNAVATFAHWTNEKEEGDGQQTAAATTSPLPKVDWTALGNFKSRVVAAQQKLLPGIFDKVVLAQAFTVKAPFGLAWDAWRTFCRLERDAPGAIVFYHCREEGRAFVGATPEVLCRVLEAKLTTHAVAGTAKRGQSEQEDEMLGDALLTSSKDLGEHACVVAHVRACLAPYLREELTAATSPVLLRLPHVQHLVTEITATLAQSATAYSVACALHPTPAVCGTPSALAKRYLAETEPFERGLYAGFVGWQNSAGDGVFAVGIRSMLICPEVATLYAGAGIVPASIPEIEDQETQWKARGAAQALEGRQRLEENIK